MAISRIRIVGADKTVGFLKHAVKKISDPKQDLFAKCWLKTPSITVIDLRDRNVRRVALSTFDFKTFDWGNCFDEMTLFQLRMFGEVRYNNELFVVVDYGRKIQLILGKPDIDDIHLFPDVVFDPFFIWSVLASLFSSRTTLGDYVPTMKHDIPPTGMRYQDSSDVEQSDDLGPMYWKYQLIYQIGSPDVSSVEIVRVVSHSDYKSGRYR